MTGQALVALASMSPEVVQALAPLSPAEPFLGAHLPRARDALHRSHSEIFLWHPPRAAFDLSLRALLFQHSEISPHYKQ